MNSSEMLELRINSPSVRLYPETPETITDDATALQAMTPGPDSPSIPSICLLQGPLQEFLQYARQEASKWLIDIAHDICDPAQQRGSLLVWQELQQEWTLVGPTDPLTASLYRYHLPNGTTVGLSKISRRENKSRTTANGDASTMGNRVLRRDGECWATGAIAPLLNSHICPKRLGDHTARIIFGDFTSLAVPANLSIYDEIFGITFTIVLDALFDKFQMGLRFLSPDNYECHVFSIIDADLEETVAGRFRRPSMIPVIHGLRAAPPHPQSDNIPPAGLIRWHYLQCVLRRFAHKDYKSLPNIDLFEQPFRVAGDSDDDEGTDSEFDWPSKVFDLGREAENDLREREERNRAVATWIEST